MHVQLQAAGNEMHVAARSWYMYEKQWFISKTKGWGGTQQPSYEERQQRPAPRSGCSSSLAADVPFGVMSSALYTCTLTIFESQPIDYKAHTDAQRTTHNAHVRGPGLCRSSQRAGAAAAAAAEHTRAMSSAPELSSAREQMCEPFEARHE